MYGPGYRGGWGAHHAVGFAIVHLVVFVLIVALILLVLFALWRWLGRRYPPAVAATIPAAAMAAPSDALAVVRMRYAHGEIDRDEFVRMSNDLGASSTSTGGSPPAVA